MLHDIKHDYNWFSGLLLTVHNVVLKTECMIYVKKNATLIKIDCAAF